MIILRVFLYFICVASIGWSVLVFGGPPIIKKLIFGYFDGAVVPTGVTVSPRLDVSISRLEFNFQNEIAGQHIEGFSRAMKLAWSLFGEKPFLELSLGPSLVKDFASVDRVKLYTPPFHKIDWQNIPWSANIGALSVGSFSKMDSVTLAGNLNLGTKKVSNISVDADMLKAKNDSWNYSASVITGEVSELNFKVSLSEQLFSSTFFVENITEF